MQLQQVVERLTQLFPPEYAASWDNTGLLTGDPNKSIHQILLTIDLTTDVIQEANQRHIDLVMAYHPPLIQPVKRLVHDQPLVEACASELAVFAPHTIWDALPGGGNDVLANLAQLEHSQCIVPVPVIQPLGEQCQYKLVSFVPQEQCHQVLQALFAAGAGQIGHYGHCSFRTRGIGSFRGDPTTKPVLGQAEKDCQVEELRIEVTVPQARLHQVILALLQAHPYEQPAFDVCPVVASQQFRRHEQVPGFGRIGPLHEPTTCGAWLAALQSRIPTEPLLGYFVPEQPLERVAVSMGSGNGIWQAARKQGADLLLTGEMSHHHLLAARQAGLQVVLLRHGFSEALSLPAMQLYCEPQFPDIEFHRSQHAAEPLVLYTKGFEEHAN